MTDAQWEKVVCRARAIIAERGDVETFDGMLDEVRQLCEPTDEADLDKCNAATQAKQDAEHKAALQAELKRLG